MQEHVEQFLDLFKVSCELTRRWTHDITCEYLLGRRCRFVARFISLIHFNRIIVHKFAPEEHAILEYWRDSQCQSARPFPGRCLHCRWSTLLWGAKISTELCISCHAVLNIAWAWDGRNVMSQVFTKLLLSRFLPKLSVQLEGSVTSWMWFEVWRDVFFFRFNDVVFSRTRYCVEFRCFWDKNWESLRLISLRGTTSCKHGAFFFHCAVLHTKKLAQFGAADEAT